ncbi:FAD-dependent oxidoreductase [Acuticoccus sediminis]|uniref:FAD-dependent oxidoreductase n=1 Tax=Acuticoccus sediminis TaxID=2184697 RepID=UPI001CFF2F2E|nr:FAD-dependent oxidoreductase [Acuticoccus sediminis]
MKAVDVLIVGAGPAGLSAAAVTGAAGLSTLVIDEQAAPGGQIWRAAEAVGADPVRHTALGSSYRGAMAAIAIARQHARFATESEVVDVSPDSDVLWFDKTARTLHQTRARAILVATGAMERPVPFPGWTLPGVTGVGALQIALKQGGMVPDGPVVLAGQGPLLLLVAQQLAAFGVPIAATLDVAPAFPSRTALGALPGAIGADPGLVAKGAALAARRFLSGSAYRDIRDLEAVGAGRIEAVRFRAAGETVTIPTTRLAVHDGVIPNTQLTRLLGLAHRWIDGQAAFAPQVDADGLSSRENVWVAGDGAGIGGAERAAAQGAATARAICRALGTIPATGDTPRGTGARTFVDRLYAPLPVSHFAADDTLLCRCESVTFGDVRRVIADGATGPNRVKTATRCGMGPCQGRICGANLTRLVAEETGRAPRDVGALRIRPPLKPLLLADYATLAATDSA